MSCSDREVGGFPIDLWLISSLSHVLFQGLVLLLIGCIRAGLVLLEVTNELRVNTYPAGDDAHDILSEHCSLVTAEAVVAVSQEPKMRTRRFSAIIRSVAKARARVAASGRPSGTATTTNAAEVIKMCVKAISFSLAVLRKENKIRPKRGDERERVTVRVLQCRR